MEIYKIRNKKGLYWEGSLRFGADNPESLIFTIKGKQWKQKEHAILACKSHGICLGYKYLRDNCEIVKFELKEVETFKIK